MLPLCKGENMPEIAVLIPCYNEELTIEKVVNDFRRELPDARIYVFDNNSVDATALLASGAGATVIVSPQQGKGNVVRHMFLEINVDVYLLVDGDDTYPAESARTLIDALHSTGADMVVGMRLQSSQKEIGAFRLFHRFGNRLVAGLISSLFRAKVVDVMSGYRALTKAFVKGVPLCSEGFEIETEMTLQALTKQFVIREVPIDYGVRPEGSSSKLNTYSDGYRVLRSIFIIFKDYKPLYFFSVLSLFLAFLSVLCGVLPIVDYIAARYVLHVPLAILAVGAGILSAISMSIGLVLDTIAKYHAENFEMLRRAICQRR